MSVLSEQSAWERIGIIREWLTDLSGFAADIEDPAFSVAVQKSTSWVVAAGEALTERRVAERSVA